MTSAAGRAGRGGPAVLIGFAESLAAIECAWLLRDAGYEVHAFTRAGTRPPLAHSRGITLHRVTSPQHDATESAAAISLLAERVGAAAVLPLDDDAVWLADRALGLGLAAPVAGPVGPAAALALDKRLQLAAAGRAGFCVPETLEVDPGGDVEPAAVPASRTGWVAKPALAAEASGGRLRRPGAFTADSLDRLRAQLSGTDWPILVQPRLRGTGEGVFGFGTGGQVVAWSGHRRVRMMNPSGSGASACRSREVPGPLRSATQTFVAATGWSGLFMVEVLRAEDGPTWFMELNGRPWGSMALASRRGLPYPLWAVQAAVGGSPVFGAEPVGDVTCRHAGREIVHLAFVGRSALRGDAPAPGLGRSLADVLRWRDGESLYNYRPGEARTFLADTWGTLRSQLGRRR